MVTGVHIHAPAGYYLGQVRRRGAQRWRTVTGKCKTDTAAMARAVLAMNSDDKRARVIWCTYDGWYGPSLSMQCAR